jgi:hypothetical protein
MDLRERVDHAFESGACRECGDLSGAFTQPVLADVNFNRIVQSTFESLEVHVETKNRRSSGIFQKGIDILLSFNREKSLNLSVVIREWSEIC